MISTPGETFLSMGQKQSSREESSSSASASATSSFFPSSTPLNRFVRQNSCGRKNKPLGSSESDQLLLEDNLKIYMNEIKAYNVGTWLHELGLLPKPVKEEYYNKMMSHYALLTTEEKKIANAEHGEPPSSYTH